MTTALATPTRTYTPWANLVQIVEDPEAPNWPLLAVQREVGGKVEKGFMVAGGGPTVFHGTIEEARKVGADPDVLEAKTWAGGFKVRFLHTEYTSWPAVSEAGWRTA